MIQRILVLTVFLFCIPRVGWAEALSSFPLSARLRAVSNPKSQKSEDIRLTKYMDVVWDYSMFYSPDFAASIGERARADQWSDRSLRAHERSVRDSQEFAKALQTFDPKKLSPARRLDLELLKYESDREIEESKLPVHLLAISQLHGPQQSVARSLKQIPTRNAQNYEDIISRLQGVPKIFRDTQEVLQEGLKQGVTMAQVSLKDVPSQIQALMTDDPMASPLLESFKQMPDQISESEKSRLKEAAIAVYQKDVRPALNEFYGFVTKEYIPKARVSIAIKDVPNGEAIYNVLIRRHTSLALGAEEIHQTGLAEVRRIRAEMEKVKDEVKFKGDLEKFFKFMTSDKKFFYKNREDLIAGYRELSKRVDPELPKLFGKMPRLPYGILPVPEFTEKSAPAAYYQRGSLKAGRAGYFFANTYALETRAKWEMEALTLHEAVPGHHFQIALAEEMENVHKVRMYGGSTAAFWEGWGLYSESLGKELGLYKDPNAYFGRLTMEMLRAIRLVVDTGMHVKGWTRQQALDFFAENSAYSKHDSAVEVDRYIAWPGQALAYKIGELKILELRKFAQTSLGEKFDIRKFHDQVLGQGTVPLSVLESQIKGWVASVKSETKRPPTSKSL